MDSDNLRALVEDFKEKGNSDESIVKLLTTAGYDEEKIREYLGQNSRQQPTDNQNTDTKNSEASDLASSVLRSKRGLPLMTKFADLIRSADKIFIERIWTLVGICAFPILFSAFIFSPLVYNFGRNSSVSSGAIAVVALFLLTLLNGLAGLAIIYSLKDKSDIVQSYVKAWKSVLNYYWILLLSFLIGFGGLVMGLIPAFIFGIWFAFAGYVYVFYGQKGINALLRSKEYVTDYWWDVFWRFFLLGIVFWVINLVVRFIGSLSPEIGTGIAYVVQLVIFPFGIIFSYLIFHNLTEIKPELATTKVSGRRGFFAFSAWLGLAVIIIGIWAGITFVLPVFRQNTPSAPILNAPATGQLNSGEMDNVRIHNVSLMEMFLEIYFNAKGQYPPATTWSAMQSELGSAINTVPQIATTTPNLGYCYNQLDNGKSYIIGARLANNNSEISQALQGVRCGDLTCGVSAASYVYCFKP